MNACGCMLVAADKIQHQPVRHPNRHPAALQTDNSTDGDVRYVYGCRCPRCDHKTLGVELRNSNLRSYGWLFRIPVTPQTVLRCEECGYTVPRNYWLPCSR